MKIKYTEDGSKIAEVTFDPNDDQKAFWDSFHNNIPSTRDRIDYPDPSRSAPVNPWMVNPNEISSGNIPLGSSITYSDKSNVNA